MRWETLEIRNCGGSIAKERAEFNCEPRLIRRAGGLEIEIEIEIGIKIEIEIEIEIGIEIEIEIGIEIEIDEIDEIDGEKMNGVGSPWASAHNPVAAQTFGPVESEPAACLTLP